ncbi:MAG TPA: CAP domain-containing protein [Hyphomicrobiaceae bacterium]|nr:CAP domain-containing protein [Hyphomicrobiaceae bacterium]
MTDLPDLLKTEAAIIEQTNAFRRSEKLSPVTINAELTAAARLYADYLARTGKFAHEADGRQPGDRVKAAGYKFCHVAENLAMHLDSRGFKTEVLATKAVEGWKASPGHRKNMVAPNVTEIGVGVIQARDQHPKFLSVQLFARPEHLKIQFRIENKARSSVNYQAWGRSHGIEPRVSITHTTCEPTEIAFERAGNFLTGVKLGARFEARDRTVYSVIETADGKVRVDISAFPAMNKK